MHVHYIYIGFITYFSIYKWLPAGLTPTQQYQYANKHIPIGTEFTLIEPYFKTRQDGTAGIRVDDPKDFILGHDINIPKSYIEWKNEGNKLFINKQLDQALSCYKQSLSSLLTDNNIVYLLLLNLSLCCLKLCEYELCVLYAHAASVLGEHAEDQSLLCKAYYRCYSACVALKVAPLVGWFSQCIKRTDLAFWRREVHGKSLSKGLEGLSLSSSGHHDSEGDAKKAGEHTAAAIAQVLELSIPSLMTYILTPPALPPTAGSDKDAEALKGQATELFQAQKHIDAKAIYLQALHAVASKYSYADILRNQSACYLGTSLPHDAAVTAVCSLLLVPISDKAIYRLSKLLMELRAIESARTVCTTGLQVLPDNYVLTTLLTDINTIIHAKNATQKGGPKPENKSVSSRYASEKYVNDEIYEQNGNNMMSAEAMRTMNNFSQLASSGIFGAPKKGTPADLNSYLTPYTPITFHTEYIQSNLLPKYCNTDICYKKLDEAYELARMYKFNGFSLIQGMERSQGDWLKRWGLAYLDPTFTQWLASARPGDVRYCDPKAFQTMYIPTILQTFSNCSYSPGEVRVGQTHVSIGFVDLGSLIYNDLISEAPTTGSASAAGGGGAGATGDGAVGVHRWVGYERSAYCVAKTLVVAELMRTSTAEIVLQVWYSSTWSTSTKKAFTAAVTSILGAKNPASLDPDVTEFLTFWLSHDVSLKAAREGWMKAQNNSLMYIANFTRSSDRQASCSYIFSGQLLSGQVGSTVMFSNPPEHGDLALDHDFLQTIHYPLLVEQWVSSKKGSDSNNIVDIGVNIVLARLNTWMEHIKAGRVQIEVHHKTISRDDSVTLAEIRAQQPALISWSNVTDYMHPRDYFTVARAISVPTTTIATTARDAAGDSADGGTLHRLYSMNWCQATFGTVALDYPKEAVKAVIDKGDACITRLNKQYHLDKTYLTTDNIDNHINSTMYYLACKYHTKWLDAFFGFGHDQVDAGSRQAEVCPYNHFARGQGTVMMSFKLK